MTAFFLILAEAPLRGKGLEGRTRTGNEARPRTDKSRTGGGFGDRWQFRDPLGTDRQYSGTDIDLSLLLGLNEQFESTGRVRLAAEKKSANGGAS